MPGSLGGHGQQLVKHCVVACTCNHATICCRQSIVLCSTRSTALAGWGYAGGQLMLVWFDRIVLLMQSQSLPVALFELQFQHRPASGLQECCLSFGNVRADGTARCAGMVATSPRPFCLPTTRCLVCGRVPSSWRESTRGLCTCPTH